MKTTIIAGLLGVLLIGAGCVGTVNDRTTGGMPFVKDRVEGRYKRPAEQIFQSAKDVILSMGAVASESTIYSDTNQVRTLQGRVNQRSVWVRVTAEDPVVSSVIVQTRTQGGLADLDLAHEIEKQIALRLR